MASDLQLGQKLGMSLDDLIKKTQASKKKKAPTKVATDKKKPGSAKKAVKAKPAPAPKGKRQNKPAEHKPKQTGAIKKNTAKKPNHAAAPNAPKRVPAPNAPKRVGANPRGGNRNAQPSETRVGDLLKMNVAVSSKRDAQAAMKMAKQLEAEARKYLGPPPSNERQPQQQRAGGARQQHRQQQRQVSPPRQMPQQRTQQRRVPYSVPQSAHWPETETYNYLADNGRMSDRDSDQMDMDMDEPDLKPNLAALQAQATQFARGVRGQSRR